MKKYILAALFCGTFTFCSCSGFLDEVPKGQITTESYYRTEQHAISAIKCFFKISSISIAGTLSITTLQHLMV